MRYLRLLLFPISILYGLVTIIRNWCYDAGIFKSSGFDMPLISVGNLDVGGAGKTPMTEYLIRLLEANYQLATLSRGYGRETKGYRTVNIHSPASEVGDEPAQLKSKFPNVNVTVCEDRVTGVRQLQQENDVIILDDAYQHRAIKPGFSILLFDYHKLMGLNLLLPAGDRRELFAGRERADVVVVSKCPLGLDKNAQQKVSAKLGLYAHQQLFFSGINYLSLQKDGRPAELNIDGDTTVFLLTGIARPEPLIEHIKLITPHLVHHKYADHHRFSPKNIAKLADDFSGCAADKKLIITTEKDLQRLQERELLPVIETLPIYTLPIGVAFLNNSGQQFNQLIQNYVRQYTAHRGLHQK